MVKEEVQGLAIILGAGIIVVLTQVIVIAIRELGVQKRSEVN